jgi:acyl-CoA thioesterase-1
MKSIAGPRNAFVLAQVGLLAALFNVLMSLSVFSSALAEPNKPIRIVAFGDSLSSGYGLRPNQSFPAQLQKELKARGHNVVVTNAGVAGDTTANGLERIGWAIGDDTDAVILEFGANDALRGIDPKVTRANLEKILAKLAKRNIPVLLTGMRSPANWGDTYAEDFDGIFPDLAKKNALLFYPFFLEGVVLNSKFNQDDGMHPNSKGVAQIVRAMLPSVEQLIGKATAQRASASKS